MASYPSLGATGQEYILEEQYKTLFGYPNGKVNSALSSEVPGTSRPFILQNQIYSQIIPTTAPTDLSSDQSEVIGNVNVTYQYSLSVGIYLKKYLNVQLSNSFLSTAPDGGALTWWFIGANVPDQADQVTNNILNRGVPNNLDPKGGYVPQLYINEQEQLFGNAQYPWTYNVNSGIVLFTGSSKYISGTPSNNTPNPTDIILMTFWRYDGTIGVSGSTGSGTTGATGATGETGATGATGESYWEATTTPINGIQYGALSVENNVTNTGSIYTQNIKANDTTANVNLYTNLTTGSLTIGSTGTNSTFNSALVVGGQATFNGNLVSTTGLIVKDSSLQFRYNEGEKYINTYLTLTGELTFQPFFASNSYKFQCLSIDGSSDKSLFITYDKTTIESALEVGGTATFKNYVPECGVTATSGNQLTNKNYVDSKTTNQILNFSPTEVSNIKKSIIYRKDTTITTNSILARLDNVPTIPQVYTFGKKISTLWVAVTDYGKDFNSSNGINWTANTNTNKLNMIDSNSIAYSKGRWVVGGNHSGGIKSIYWSNSGTSWNPSDLFVLIKNVASNGNYWIGVGGEKGTTENRIFNSLGGGQTWTGVTNDPFKDNGGQGMCVVWNGQMWVAGGSVGNSAVDNPRSFATSTDGENWTKTSGLDPFLNGTSGYVNGIAWNGQMWVAVGYGVNNITIGYSYDSNSWYSAGNPFETNGKGWDVAWNGNLWVAVGEGANDSIIYSRDGINWTVSIAPMFNGVNYYVKSIKWNGSMWVAVGYSNPNYNSSNTAYSINGVIWFSGSVEGGNYKFNSVAFNRGYVNTITFNNSATGSVSDTNITLIEGDQLDVVCDSYYNTGFTNFSISIDA